MATTSIRAVNLQLQQLALHNTLAEVTCRLRPGRLTSWFRLQPSVASRAYSLRLEYRHGRRPQVWVVDPHLTLHPSSKQLPHVHHDGSLCLWYRGEWADNMLLAHTIVPWAAEWLLHYEVWLATGTWTGGGHAH